tara:strand:- start:159 stop:1226 length:1068 start_codon:yes stop_codon:yes gene_type:complete
MGGGLLQLVAYGAQDVYLTGNPQITFFKVVYRRHTNFSIESIQQTFNGSAGPNKRVTCQISRNGDLVHKLYVVFDSTASAALTKDARDYIKKVEVEIGGQLIDRQYGDWMKIWNELTLPAGKKEGYDTMVMKAAANTGKRYVPLEFWFCRNIGLALPLIALQYHEVKINIEFDDEATPANFTDATLWADYIFLDTDERRRFAQLSHEYLIEQLQYTGDETMTNSKLTAKLSFNHPVKELIWRTTDSDGTTAKESGSAKLMLNGNDRFAQRDAKYFTHVQPYQHHTNIPDMASHINVYSFALKPEEHQPSGTLNMSRIDTAQLQLTNGDGTTTKIYAHSYNVLRILSGMGGLAYSN